MDWFDWGREDKCPFLVGNLQFLCFVCFLFFLYFCLLCCRDSVRFPSWPHGGAKDPPSLSGSGSGKSGGAVGEGVGAGVGVSSGALQPELRCSLCGLRRAAGGGWSPEHNFWPVPQLLPEFVGGFSRRDWTLLPHHRQHVPGSAAGSGSGSGRAGLRGQYGGTVR